ncbi:MAG: DUF4011 domain-containing protein [Methanomassiliicoccus sp.]|nr:DUF4011 domain-containing protein [Methanomassiliicoccus sp.]
MSTSSPHLDRKIERWCQSLLDMTLRNRLLNFKPRSAVQIVRPDGTSMFDLLVKGERTLTFREMAEEESREPVEAIALAGDQVLPPYDPRGLNDTLRKMRLKARSHLQEQGVNILYLSFGLVRWYEEADSDEELLSPLVLVPVELIKEGPLSPFKLRTIDEDIVINPSLDYKLGSTYGLPLPEWPEEPLPLTDYIGKARTALTAVSTRWSVDDRCFLGLFSFAKLAMYKEMMSERTRIVGHPFINALSGDQSMLPVVPDHLVADKLDDTVRPEDSFQVLDADSSQQEAVEMSKRGISFVLQGPPGTGKSQTIANIIAEALAVDRKVLFVSEKMAALEVVKKRLDDRGLGDYCLEIHSRKASKTVVMDEVRRSMMALPTEPTALDDLQRLERVRDELNGYVRALHRPRGKMERSAFYAYGRVAALADSPELPVAVPDALSLGLADLDDRLKLVKRLQSLRSSLERMEGHPWSDLRTNGWAAGDEVMMERSLQELRDRVRRLRDRTASLGAIVGIDGAGNLAEARWMMDLMHRATTSPSPEASWLRAGRPEELMSEIDVLQELYSKRAYNDKWVRDNYAPELSGLDLRGMSRRFSGEYRGPLRVLKGRYRQEMGSLQRCRRDGRKMGYEEAAADLRRLVAIDEHVLRTQAAEASGALAFGKRFKGDSTDWQEVRRVLQWSSRFMSDARRPLSPAMVSVLSGPVGAAPELLGAVREADQSLEEVSSSAEWLDHWFSIKDAPGSLQTMPLPRFDELAAAHLAEMGSLKEWLEVSSLERSCRDGGLGEVFDLGRRKRLPSADLAAAYEKRAFRSWLDQACAAEPLLRDFRSEEHEEAIALFRRLDEKQLEIAQRRLRNLLNTRRERVLNAPAAKTSELGMLRHEAAKKKRFKPIRQLFQDCPGIIMDLKPCLLMSPLSVSMFLDPAAVGFDLVIFDEASQVRPEDAIGSIMRAKQVIVVGDSRQLPPTSFFRNANGEDAEDEMEDLESILDECTALSIRQPMLMWHYRSRHESLIAFSNSRIYDGRLITFPSPGREDGEWGVVFVHVPEGVYDRAGTRTNPVEARKVAELVFEHFARSPERSLGVVAFSEPQQMAIIEELEALRGEDQDFERFFVEGGMQEFFVKNLENVQGDERDVMIFSVGYGRDAQGKMYQNFGPLNKAGGERRLNVAITRARMHVKLVSSITSEEVDGSSSQGAKLLREYLAYAASGGDRELLQAGQTRRPAPDVDSMLEDEVFRVLTDEGLTLRRRVGCSGYRIDMAVEDPDRPGSFILGIECDGATYRSGKTARDRDRTREGVLRGLGWNLHRIWSKDWTSDRPREVAKVKRALEAARAPSRPSVEEGGAQAEAGEVRHGEKETFRPALLDLIRDQAPVHVDIARDVLDDHVHQPEDVDQALSENLFALVTDGTIVVRDGFIWPSQMTKPPVRRPLGKEPMELEYVSLEEIGEAEMYNMSVATEISRRTLIQRTASFYQLEEPSEKARERLEHALDRLIREGMLVPRGKDLLHRAR